MICMIKDRNFYNYFLLASTASLIDIALLYVLTDITGLFYLISACFSFVTAQIINYILNKKLNFNHNRKPVNTTKQMAIFIAVNTVGLGISLVILATLVEFLGIWYIMAKIISMLVAVNFNYYMHKNYTFALTFIRKA